MSGYRDDIRRKDIGNRDDIYRRETGRDLVRDSHQANIERRLMERGSDFNLDIDRRRRGEITGTKFDEMNEAHGMPMRGFVDSSSKRNKYENPTLDFDLFDPANSDELEMVGYFDPYTVRNKEFGEFEQDDDRDLNSLNLNKLDISYPLIFSDMFDYFIKMKNLVISPFSLYQGLFMLYLSSNDQHLANFLSVTKVPKQVAYKEITVKIQDIQKAMGSLASVNIVFVPNTVKLNQEFLPVANLFSTIVQYSAGNAATEVERIGELINKFTKGHLKESVSEDVLRHGDCLVHSSTIININFQQAGVESTESNFNGRKMKMVQVNTGDLWYVRDNETIVIEIPIDKRLVFGIYCNNHNKLPTNDQLSKYISMMSKTSAAMIRFPVINQLAQVNYSKFLSSNKLLEKIRLEDMLVNSPITSFSRYYQTVKISVIGSGKVLNLDSVNRGLYCDINTPFIYWVKDKVTEYIVTIGVFV